jgi:hypothetical protein
MSLEMRPAATLRCGSGRGAGAFICSFECTFCANAETMAERGAICGAGKLLDAATRRAQAMTAPPRILAIAGSTARAARDPGRHQDHHHARRLRDDRDHRGHAQNTLGVAAVAASRPDWSRRRSSQPVDIGADCSQDRHARLAGDRAPPWPDRSRHSPCRWCSNRRWSATSGAVPGGRGATVAAFRALNEVAATLTTAERARTGSVVLASTSVRRSGRNRDAAAEIMDRFGAPAISPKAATIGRATP